MKLEEKISQAKAKLLVEYPYFGTLASKISLEINDDIESFKSDGKKIEYREEYLADLELSEIEFILANGAMHKALAHENRKGNRSGWLWRMATDIAINDMLIENGLDIPYGAEYRKRFAGMYAEEIYAELKDDILRDDEDLEYEADDAEDVEQNNEPKGEEQIEEEVLTEQLQAEEAIALLEQKFQEGEVPESIERFFDISQFGKIDWRDELRDAIDKYYRDDYTLIPPSKKLLYQGIYLPSNISNTFKLVIAIDSSGSIDEILLNEFLSEVNFLMEHLQNYQIDLLVCDDKIHSHKTFYSGEALDVQIIGNGGTDFRPVFEFVDQNIDEVKLLLYFTDLDGVFPKEPPNYAVKWISSNEKEAPFGELILLQ
jgi:predicted metal-dependent peptidase